MAVLTPYFGVTSFQFECEQIMVKIRIIPISRGMAEFTTLAIFSIMFIFSGVAGVTIFWCASVFTICMAFLAGSFHMLTHQFEVSEIVIELGGLPAFGCMAFRAILPKPSIMLIIGGMTGETILRSRLQIQYRARIQVAFRTRHFCMFSV